MTNSLSLSDIVTIIGFAIVVGGLVASYVKTTSKLNTISQTLTAAFTAYTSAFTSLTAGLLKSKALRLKDYLEVQKLLSFEAINKTLDAILKGSPISKEEAKKLKEYAQRVEMGEMLSKKEADEFYTLSKKVSEERRSDVGDGCSYC